MARAERTGFDYTRLDVDFWSDLKVRKAKRKNSLAPYVFLRIVTFILKEGYYVKCDSDLCFLLSEDLGISEEMVMECLDILTSEEVNLLDHNTYVNSCVLTSHGIQMQYNAQCDASKRKSKLRKTSPFSLVISSEETHVSSEEMPVNSEETHVSSEEMPQRKEKKSKEKEISSSCCSSSAGTTSAEEEKQQQSFVLNFFLRNWKDPKKEFFTEFIPWNNSGGRRWAAMDRDQREAALIQWHQDPPCPARFTQQFLDMWEQLFYQMTSLPDISSDIIWAALDDELKWEMCENGRYLLTCRRSLGEFIERHLDKLKPIFQKHYSPSIKLRYCAYDDNTQRTGD